MQQRTYRAVIFDLDGVIVDSEPLHEAAFRAVFAELGHAADHGVDFTAYYGTSDRTVWRDFLGRHPQAMSLELLVTRKEQRFVELLRVRRPVFGGLDRLLQQLAQRAALAVASGSTHRVIGEALALDDLRRHFRAVVSADDVARGKPEPDIFLRAAEHLGVSPVDCCVIEDSPFGVTAAGRAGMDVIAISNSVPAARLAHAGCVVSDYGELARLLLERTAVRRA